MSEVSRPSQGEVAQKHSGAETAQSEGAEKSEALAERESLTAQDIFKAQRDQVEDMLGPIEEAIGRGREKQSVELEDGTEVSVRGGLGTSLEFEKDGRKYDFNTYSGMVSVENIETGVKFQSQERDDLSCAFIIRTLENGEEEVTNVLNGQTVPRESQITPLGEATVTPDGLERLTSLLEPVMSTGNEIAVQATERLGAAQKSDVETLMSQL